MKIKPAGGGKDFDFETHQVGGLKLPLILTSQQQSQENKKLPLAVN
jgi:hypothetical protein